MSYIGNPLDNHSVDFRFMDYETSLNSDSRPIMTNIPVISNYNPKYDPDVILGIKGVSTNLKEQNDTNKSWWQFW